MKLIKTFVVKDNINLDVIFDFIEFYKNGSINDFYKIRIEIIGRKSNVNEIIGEIDPVFLSYIILFLKDSPEFIVEFVFNDIESADRAFSIKEQLEQMVYLNNLKSNIYLYGNYVNKSSSEIIPILLDGRLSQSQKFIPPLLIESELDFCLYFTDCYKSDNANILWQLYIEKLAYEIDLRTKQVGELINSFEIDLNSLSFFEICLFNLLLSDEFYKKRNVKKADKKVIITSERILIKYYRKFVSDISDGIKELAKNIIEHSTEKKGVITCRFFDKERLSALKGKEENDYLLQTNDHYFLDINVIDFGKYSIRETYSNNLSENKLELVNYLGNTLDDDKKIIENEYLYEDFFTINIEKFIYLEHQQNKLISRYGLHYFTHIVKENYSGYIKTSSGNEGVLIYNNSDKTEFKSKIANFIKYGTVYNCIIPINSYSINQNPKEIQFSYQKKDAQSINTFLELDNYEIVDYKDSLKNLNKKYIFNYAERKSSNQTLKKYELIIELYLELRLISTQTQNNIFAINAANINLGGESEWLRFLAGISLFFKDLIIYNIDIETVKRIVNLRRITSNHPLLKFWNSENRILFYSYKFGNEHHNSRFKRYGANILTGESEDVFNAINQNIWRHHYSFKEGIFAFEKDFLNDKINYITDNSRLFCNGKLLYFELILGNEQLNDSRLTLFEESVQYSLNKRFDVLRNSNTNNKGYKITDTHFRLGSKIHIQDFYYAKRMFQNSFFTIPLSYLLTVTIFELIGNLKEITLIGYEDYSVFLTSSIRNMLVNRINQAHLSIKVNHNTISKDGKLSKDVHTIKQNCIIIVPIVSSFSTSIKIQNQLIEIFKSNISFQYKERYAIITPTLNIVLVGHHKSDDKGYLTFEKLASAEIDEIEKEKNNETYFYFKDDLLNKSYNWNSINKEKKIIKVKTFINEDLLIQQKYYIPVYTEWRNADDCDLCYSDSINEEKCLIETGKASITPTLIFGYPKTKIPNKFGLNTLILNGSLLYGNLLKRNNHYLYFTTTGSIIKNNRKEIVDWLKKLKRDVFNDKLLEYKKVVLVTPSTGSKSNFIDLVNEYIFEFTANCISISLEEDYIENAESLYDDGLHLADIVIYIDDVLSTIKSFLDTNYIIKFIRKKIHTGKGIDFCITLINRMTYDSEDNLLLELPKNIFTKLNIEDQLFYYTKINNPSIEEPNNEFPLTKEMNRYKYLADTSSLDGIRELFLNKIVKLKPIDIEYNVPNSIKDHLSHNNKKLFQLLVMNQFYKLFEINKSEEISKNNLNNNRSINIDTHFREDIKSFRYLESKISNELKRDDKHKEIILKYSHNLKFIILKIMCCTPLVYYQDIRNSAFHWIIFELEELRREMDLLTNDTIKTFFSFDSDNYFSIFQQLKFLLKRSVQLKCNYIIHHDFFISISRFIEFLYSESEEIRNLSLFNTIAFNQIEMLFDSTAYSPGRLILYNYTQELSHLVQGIDFSQFLNAHDKIVLIEESEKYSSSRYQLFEDEDLGKKEFELQFKKIQSSKKYNIISSKKLIYQLIALIQELINEHETKAIRLEININKLFFDESDNGNGNFNHYLRLLKLENTAIIERFWEYFKNKETINCSQKIDIDHFEDILFKYNSDPKYSPIIQNLENQCIRSFENYIKLQSILYNWSIKEYEKIEETDLNSKISKILYLLAEIIGDVDSVFLTVNYNNFYNPPVDQLYSFEYHSKLEANLLKIFNTSEKLHDSLTYRMMCGIQDDYSLSNLEIFKNSKGIQIRTGIFSVEEIEKFTEVISLREKIEYSILVIRLSDILNSHGTTLYSSAVLTFILHRNDRTDVSRLRLVLQLKKYLVNFIKAETSKNTFLELLKNKERDDSRRKLNHGLGDYFMYQNRIIQSNDFCERNLIILEAINGAIKGQMGSYDIEGSIRRVYVKEVIKMRITSILESDLIEGKKVTTTNYSITFSSEQIYYLHSVIYDVVLLELLINAKRHSPNIRANIKIEFKQDEFVISNNMKENLNIPKKERDGISMCKSICQNLNYILTSYVENHDYFVKIKFPCNESNINN